MNEEGLEFVNAGTINRDLSQGLFTESKLSPNPPAEDFSPLNIEDKSKSNSSPVLFWGPNNDYAQQLSEIKSKCNVLESALEVKGDLFIGRGLFLYQEDYQNDRKIIEINMPTEIEDAWDASNINHYIDTAMRDFITWGNVWPLFYLSKTRKISQIRMYDAVFNRLARPNPATGIFEHIYVSSQFGVNGFSISEPIDKELKPYVKKIPLLDNFSPERQMRDSKAKVFALHVKNHTSGKAYGRVPWHSAYENGWVEISSSVPKMKSRIYQNIMNLSQIIYIHKKLWETTYGDKWGTMDQVEKNKAIKKKQQEIEKNLVGMDESGKSLFSGMDNDSAGNIIKSIIIESIDSPFKDGNLLTDAMQADTQVLNSVGIDPTILGMVSPGGGKQSAGSGSNIREAIQAISARSYPTRQKILQPLYTWMKYEGWDKKYRTSGEHLGPIKIGLRDFVINSLDLQAPKTFKEVTNP